jgi:hypothetical protein
MFLCKYTKMITQGDILEILLCINTTVQRCWSLPFRGTIEFSIQILHCCVGVFYLFISTVLSLKCCLSIDRMCTLATMDKPLHIDSILCVKYRLKSYTYRMVQC